MSKTGPYGCVEANAALLGDGTDGEAKDGGVPPVRGSAYINVEDRGHVRSRVERQSVATHRGEMRPHCHLRAGGICLAARGHALAGRSDVCPLAVSAANHYAIGVGPL